MIARVQARIKFRRALPEQLVTSDSAEMEFNGTDYVVSLSLLLAGGSGEISQRATNTAGSVAVYYAAAAEIARAKGRSDLVISAGQKIALCDADDIMPQHPIRSLFPELLNKTLNG